MSNGSDDDNLARDMINVHGKEAAIVARENARAAAVAGQAEEGEVLDQGARGHPAAAGRQGIAYSDLTAVISSLRTVNLLSVFGPNVTRRRDKARAPHSRVG
jgi:hypothetical protein